MAAPFATLDQLAARHPAELTLLAADETTGLRDDARVDAALRDASVEVRSILQARYTPADIANVDEGSAEILAVYTMDIALYRVALSFARSSDRLKEGYENAVKRLEAIAAGKGALTIAAGTAAPAPTDADEAGEIGPNGVVIDVPPRIFSRETFRGTPVSAGISITVDAADFGPVVAKLMALARFDGSTLMSAIGALGESQTRRRIESEKTAPDGTPWAPNRNGSSILLETGQHLLGSVAWTSSADQAEWGASWQYAHVHQDGAVIKPTTAKNLAFMAGGHLVLAKQVTVPARPFVGLSTDNRTEILDLVTDVFGGLLA